MQATATTLDHEQEHVPVNSRNKVVIASLIGTAIEFFDFYIYATAAVIVFPLSSSPGRSHCGNATIARHLRYRVCGASDWLCAIRSLRRPGRPQSHAGGFAADDGDLHGHYRSVTGLRDDRFFAPLLLALARFGQGLGLGGEWGGAALLATENAPPRKRALYGSFPQLGAPIGFFFANGTFLLLSAADRRAVYELGLARAVYLLGGAGDYRPVCARVAA